MASNSVLYFIFVSLNFSWTLFTCAYDGFQSWLNPLALCVPKCYSVAFKLLHLTTIKTFTEQFSYWNQQTQTKTQTFKQNIQNNGIDCVSLRRILQYIACMDVMCVWFYVYFRSCFCHKLTSKWNKNICRKVSMFYN